MKSTANPPTTEERDSRPPDIEIMRAGTRRLLAEDGESLGADELDTYFSTLRGHMELLIPEVEQAAGRLSKDDIPRYCALACVGEARGRLRIELGPGYGPGIAHVRRLSRSLNALCDHYENLGGAHPGAGQ